MARCILTRDCSASPMTHRAEPHALSARPRPPLLHVKHSCSAQVISRHGPSQVPRIGNALSLPRFAVTLMRRTASLGLIFPTSTHRTLCRMSDTPRHPPHCKFIRNHLDASHRPQKPTGNHSSHIASHFCLAVTDPRPQAHLNAYLSRSVSPIPSGGTNTCSGWYRQASLDDATQPRSQPNGIGSWDSLSAKWNRSGKTPSDTPALAEVASLLHQDPAPQCPWL